MYVNEPVNTVGAIRNTTGNVPTNIGHIFKLMIPHNTEVGQSGPPTKIAHLAALNPGSVRISLIERIMFELIPTKERTFTFPDSRSPINFC
mmetsp:Transcript_5147/g.7866  ORF Transcript_5147/g.7866 Transcript_5147/m.7866 type:complete len:91 (+) Transcript_5147:851-1123(+)